jgi:hypothetical protein
MVVSFRNKREPETRRFGAQAGENHSGNITGTKAGSVRISMSIGKNFIARTTFYDHTDARRRDRFARLSHPLLDRAKAPGAARGGRGGETLYD